MNHLTTEPTESKSGDGTYTLSAMATVEKETRSVVTGEIAEPKKSKKPRPTFVPPLDPIVGIELRVTRAGMPARRLRINSTRCTFGNGEGCTVRLSDAGLRPLHAVILRDNGRILIRGYSEPLEINGECVAESFLSLGDVIRLGQYCFEMIDLPPSEADGDRYEDEKIEATYANSKRGDSTDGNALEASKPHSKDSRVATDDLHSNEIVANPKRLKFSQSLLPTDFNPSLRAASPSALEGLQFSHAGVPASGRRDEVIDDAPAVREPITSLAQIHVQAKRNSELMAEVAAVRQRELETNKKLSATVERLETAHTEVAEATVSIVALKSEIVSLNDQFLRLTSDAQEQHSVAVAEQAKLNRTLASLRDSSASSQKAEAATRQALQESIRQRDEALAQRAMAVDAQQLSRAKLEEADAQIRRLNQEAENRLDLLARLESESEKLRARINDVRDVCCDQADQITKLSTALEASQSSELAAVSQLKITIEQMQKELDASRQRIKAADLERVQLSTLQSTLDSTLQEHISEKISWRAQVEKLNQKLEALSVELQSAKDEVNRSRTEAAQLKTQIGEMHSQVADAQSELSSRPTIEKLQEVQSQLALSESDLENAERRLTQLREDYDQLASQRITQDSNQALPLPTRSITTALPGALFPIPRSSDSVSNEDLPVDASLASNVQEIPASAFAALALTESDGNTDNTASDSAGTTNDPEDEPLSTSDGSGGASLNSRYADDNETSTGSIKNVLFDAAGDQIKGIESKPQSQATAKREEAPVSDSSWKTPSTVTPSGSSGGWNVSQSTVSQGKPLQPPASAITSRSDRSSETVEQSKWMTSNHSRTHDLPTDRADESRYSEPMNRQSGASYALDDEQSADVDFSPTSRFEDAAINPAAFRSSLSISDSAAKNLLENSSRQQSVEEDSDADDERLLAALIQRSEGSSGSWFADYTASQKASNDATEKAEVEDSQAILDRLSQYVRNSDSAEDELGDAIAESQYNGLDPETSALSLARMLINELDAATHIDHDSSNVPPSQDPMVKSKRLVGASVSEEDSASDETHDNDDLPPQPEMRRKDFDERAFRKSLEDSANVEVVDPNDDQATYSIQSHSDRPATTSFQANQPEEEEDSVEAYMNQLLRRMGQEPTSPAKAAVEAAKPAPNRFPDPRPQEAAREKPEVVRPKRTAAELEVPMDQMRELAKQSAESAISTSNRNGAKELRSKATIDGAQACVVAICGVVFFYCGLTSSNLSLVWNTAGTLAIALSAFFFYEMFRKLTTPSKGP